MSRMTKSKFRKMRGSYNKNIAFAVDESTLTKSERQETAQHTLEEKNGICYGANLNGNLSVIYAGWKRASNGYRFHFGHKPCPCPKAHEDFINLQRTVSYHNGNVQSTLILFF